MLLGIDLLWMGPSTLRLSTARICAVSSHRFVPVWSRIAERTAADSVDPDPPPGRNSSPTECRRQTQGRDSIPTIEFGMGHSFAELSGNNLRSARSFDANLE